MRGVVVVVLTLVSVFAGLTPLATAQTSSAAGAAPPAPPSTPVSSGEWQRIHGTIESIEGSTLSFRTDDGRALTVDVSRVAASVRNGLTTGEHATVLAHEWTGPTTVRANYVQRDSSNPSRSGTIAPSASPRSSR